MTSPPSVIQNLARHILASQPAHAGSSGRDASPAVRACEQLGVPLTRLAGAAGFAALLSRALLLAKRQDPSLEGLRVGPVGSLEEFDERRHGPDGDEAVWNGGVVLIAELIGLLVTLIGRPLTVSLLREAWPGTPIPNLAVGTEETV